MQCIYADTAPGCNSEPYCCMTSCCLRDIQLPPLEPNLCSNFYGNSTCLHSCTSLHGYGCRCSRQHRHTGIASAASVIKLVAIRCLLSTVSQRSTLWLAMVCLRTWRGVAGASIGYPAGQPCPLGVQFSADGAGACWCSELGQDIPSRI